MNRSDILANLADYYQREIKPGVASLYLNALADIPDDDLEDAVTMWVKDGKQFMPKVVELREYSERARVKRINPDPTVLYWRAQAAFGAVLRGDLPDEVLEDRRYRRYVAG